MSLRGNCRTESDRMACSPAIRMTRLTTIARTGRLTKRSVNFIWSPFPLSSRAKRGISPSFARCASAVLRLRGRVVGRLNLVVHDDGRAVAELEDPGGH